MSGPLVTIGIPTRNAAATLAETLCSLANQTYKYLEILVSDNASTDDTVALANSYADPRIRVQEHPRDLGAEENSKSCWTSAKGKYTAIFHADDVYDPTIVEKQVSFLESHPEVGGVFTRARFMGEDGERGGLSRLPGELARQEKAVIDFQTGIRLLLRHGNFIMTPSVMVRTSILQEEIGSWRTAEFGKGADFDMWLRVLEHHPLGCLTEPLLNYRWGRHGFSSQYRHLRTETADYIRVLDHWLADTRVRAILDNSDLKAYARVRRKHDVVRASNALLRGEREYSQCLLREAGTPDLLVAAFSSRRDLRVLLAYSAVRAGLTAPRILRPALEYVSRRGS